MRRTVTFDAFDLQDTTYQTKDFMHESMNNREIGYQRLADRDGQKLVKDHFDAKTITLIGRVKGTDIDDLESKIDSLKEVLARKERNLDIEYASGTRRYTASVTDYTIERKHFHMTFAPYKIVFKVANPPYGTALDTSTADFAAIAAPGWSGKGVSTGTGTWEGNYGFTGSAPPMPTIQLTVNAETNLNKLTFTNVSSNSAISIERDFSAGEVLEINVDDYTVTVDTVAVDFTGTFPEFVADGNEFKLAVRCNTCNLTLKMIYYPFYY